MGRLEGFIFSYPGIPSLTVPYHDANDFFYSGHVGTCLLVILEYRSGGFYKMACFATFVLINQWIMLCLVRTHYIIDLITGIVMSHYFFMLSERISFVFDVLAMRIPAKKRYRAYYKYCKGCGWSNHYAGDYITEEEKYILKQIYSEQNSGGMNAGRLSEGSAFSSVTSA